MDKNENAKIDMNELLKKVPTEKGTSDISKEQVDDFINKNNKPSILICENILLYQNLCDSKFSVCSIMLFDKINLNNEQIDYYCILSDLKYLKKRYNVNIDIRLFKPVLELPDGNYLYVYDSNF